MNTALNGLLVMGILLMVAVAFGGWVISVVARSIGTILGVYPNRDPRPPQPIIITPPFPPQQASMTTNVPLGYIQCRVPGCRHINPDSAQFCRHCGHAFPQIQSKTPRRAAIY